MIEAYLTIDDSPSPLTDDLTDYLAQRNIPALFFCRGDLLEADPGPMIRAVQKGFVIGNHAYSHRRFSTLDYNICVDEIEKTERIIDGVYNKAGIAKPIKLFRFPHMDRGAGGYVVDYAAVSPQYRDWVTRLFADGLNIALTEPSPDMIAHKEKLQAYLQRQGFAQPFTGVDYPWFAGTEMQDATDCMYTFSTSDWMLLDRHRGKWPYKTIDDLKRKIDDDAWLNKGGGRAIILAHDKPEPDLFPVVKSLIDHMADKGYQFLKIA